MGEHKETGQVMLVSLTAPVAGACRQILHEHQGEENTNLKVDHTAASWQFEGNSS